MNPLNVIFLISRLLSCVISLSCVFVVVFQLRHDRKSWLFALLGIAVTVETFFALAFHVFVLIDQPGVYQIETIIFLVSSYMTIILEICVFLFCMEYLKGWTRLSRNWARFLLLLPVPTLFLIPTGIVPNSLVVNANGTIDYTISPWTYPVFGLGMVTSVIILTTLYRQQRRQVKTPQFRVLVIGGVLLLISGIYFPLLPFFKQHMIEQLSYSLACFLLVRPILQESLFNPLAELKQLAEQRAQELAEASEAKTQFLSMMSHDLRTPLQTITVTSQFMGHLELYPGTVLTSDYRDDLTTIVQTSQYMKRLVDEILDFAKIEAGAMDLRCYPLNPLPILEEISEQAQKLVRPTVKLIKDYRPLLPAIYADDVRLREILFNLVGNACNFCETGTITMDVRVVAEMLCFSVADTGPGIPLELQPSLFNRFKQAHYNTRNHGGTGLGLSIAKRLVELHGGDIWVESKPGVGATFYFTIPLATAEQLSRPDSKSLPPFYDFGDPAFELPPQIVLIASESWTPPHNLTTYCEYIRVAIERAKDVVMLVEPALTIVIADPSCPQVASDLRKSISSDLIVRECHTHELLSVLTHKFKFEKAQRSIT